MSKKNKKPTAKPKKRVRGKILVHVREPGVVEIPIEVPDGAGLVLKEPLDPTAEVVGKMVIEAEGQAPVDVPLTRVADPGSEGRLSRFARALGVLIFGAP
jgi:hypothetical protein